MLDGQTIVLDDYLQMRPENEAVIRQHVQSGRILIGPWLSSRVPGLNLLSALSRSSRTVTVGARI